MACAECLSTFHAAPEDKERASHIDQARGGCACESHQVSEYCTDPVSIQETLDRLVLDPNHIEREGDKISLKTSFFSDAASFGASCLRSERAEPSEYVETIREMLINNPIAADGSQKKLYGVARISVGIIKQITHEFRDKKGNLTGSSIAFCVYATGLENRPNHSDVMVNQVSFISRSQANRAGIKLTNIINEAIDRGEGLISVGNFKAVVDLTDWAA